MIRCFKSRLRVDLLVWGGPWGLVTSERSGPGRRIRCSEADRISWHVDLPEDARLWLFLDERVSATAANERDRHTLVA